MKLTKAQVTKLMAFSRAVRQPPPDVEERCDGAPSPGASGRVLLRLWLGGYHSPSLNVTKGGHWTQYHRLKQDAAAALAQAVGAPSEGSGAAAADAQVLREGRAALVVLATGGRRKAGREIAPAASPAAARAAGPPAVPVSLRYVRVTCQPLDFENLAGSTKPLTDCLRQAFPAWLPDDAPEYVTIEHRQERCAKRCEQGTWVVLVGG